MKMNITYDFHFCIFSFHGFGVIFDHFMVISIVFWMIIDWKYMLFYVSKMYEDVRLDFIWSENTITLLTIELYVEKYTTITFTRHTKLHWDNLHSD